MTRRALRERPSLNARVVLLGWQTLNLLPWLGLTALALMWLSARSCREAAAARATV